MADEDIQKKDTDVLKNEQEEKKNVVDEKKAALEARASDDGWRPLEKWVEEGNDPEEWRDARSFLDRGELLSKISSQSKELKEVRKALKMMEEHNLKLADVEYKKALETLRKEKKAALDAGDADRVVKVEDDIDTLKDAHAERKALAQREAVKDANTIHPEFAAWVEKNSWYAQNSAMRGAADKIGMDYAQANPGAAPSEVLKHVEREMRKEFPSKFGNPNRDRPSVVETSSSRTSSRPATKDDYAMSEQEEKVFKTLHAQDPKFWTREKYIADLKKLG